MLLIHKETGEIFEMLIKSISSCENVMVINHEPQQAYGVGEIILRNPEHFMYITYTDIPFHFEILGFL